MNNLLLIDKLYYITDMAKDNCFTTGKDTKSIEEYE